MMTRAEKDAVIKDLKEKIDKAQAMFLTNMIGIAGTDAVEIRKNVREAKGTVVVTKNSLFGKAAAGTYAEALLTNLKGTNAVAFAFEDAPAVAKAVYEASEKLERVTLGKGTLGTDLLSEKDVAALAKLPSRDQMLGTLLATFIAPVSAFARLMNAVKEEIEKQGVETASQLKVEAAASAE
jgi:large subunit ribosomal protein L10